MFRNIYGITECTQVIGWFLHVLQWHTHSLVPTVHDVNMWLLGGVNDFEGGSVLVNGNGVNGSIIILYHHLIFKSGICTPGYSPKPKYKGSGQVPAKSGVIFVGHQWIGIGDLVAIPTTDHSQCHQ